MKISVRQNCGYVDLETETTKDVYLLGRIVGRMAFRFKVEPQGYADSGYRLAVPLALLVEELAK